MLATATQPLRSFNLDLAGLEVAAVSVNGLSAPFARAQNELTITPTTALAVNLPFTVSVNYHGTPIPSWQFIGKPFDREALLVKITDVLAAAAAAIATVR